MIGVGGCGMSGLAGVLLQRGAYLSGCDLHSSEAVRRLASSGAVISEAQRAADLPDNVDVVIASAAVAKDHPQLIEARRRGAKTMKYAEALGWLMSHTAGIAISGTHGKSTTTAWTAFILERAGLDPTFIVGGYVDQLGGGSGAGRGPHFVAEACEYDRSFLNLSPKCAAILNIEADHLDYYENIAAIEQAFEEFAARVPDDGLLIVNGRDERCAKIAERVKAPVATFGDSPKDDWQCTDLYATAGRYSFNVWNAGRKLGRVTLGPAGRHNVWNALAACAVADHCGVAWEDIRTGLADFRGVGRRMTLRGEVGGLHVIDDYGHHPTEIRVTLDAIRERYSPRRLWCVFQPHQYSRTLTMLSEFAGSFEQADHVVVPDIYFVRDTEHDRQAVCASDLVERICARGGNAVYIPGFEEIATFVANEASSGDVVVTMGAGDIGNLADVLLERLRANLSD